MDLINKVKSIEVEPMSMNKLIKDASEPERGFIAKLKDENGEVVFNRTIYGTPGEDDFFRNFRNIDMMPSSLIGGIFIVIVSFIFKDGNIFTSFHDILYCILWGAILNGFMNIAFIFSTKHLHASEVSFFMLLEFSLGPFWVWIFLNELIRFQTLIGGIVVMSSVTLFTIFQINRSKIKIKLN